MEEAEVSMTADRASIAVADRDTRTDALAQRRTAAIDAFIDLLLAQGTPPRPEEVAQETGVSIATLYRYFSTLDELRHEAALRVLSRFPGLFTVADIGAGSRQERIGRFVRARAELHETLHPLELLARVNAAHDHGAARMVDSGRRFLANQARAHFVPELDTLTPARRDDVVAAIAVLTSVESWDQYRRSHDHTPAQMRRAWSAALDRLLPEP